MSPAYRNGMLSQATRSFSRASVPAKLPWVRDEQLGTETKKPTRPCVLMASRLMLFALVATSSAGVRPTLASDPRPPFKSLRYDEDYRFLADPARRTELWDAMKYIPLAG